MKRHHLLSAAIAALLLLPSFSNAIERIAPIDFAPRSFATPVSALALPMLPQSLSADIGMPVINLESLRGPIPSAAALGANGALEGLTEAIATFKDGAEAQSLGAMGVRFDGAAKLGMASFDIGGSGASDGGGMGGGRGNDGDGRGPGSPSGPSDRGQGPLGKLYPRAIIILDTLEGPASEQTVERVEKLLADGVHVVFVTARPDKGENSADSVLISRLKVRSGNPIIVASYNGARIFAKSSRAENPKPLVEEVSGFAEGTTDIFRRINTQLKAKLKTRGPLEESGDPSLESAHIYSVRLPATADLDEAVSFYNAALSREGLQYRVAGREVGGRKYLFTQSTALRLNTNRLFQALNAQFPHLADPITTLKPSETLILADSTKASKFLQTLPGKGYYIHGVTDGESLEKALGAVLGTAALEKVTVMRSQLRAYTDWQDARAKYGAPRRSGGAGRMAASPQGRYYRDLGFYRGIIMYDLMGRLYHLMRKGQYMEASPEAAEDLLRKMWYTPLAAGVRISPEMDATIRNLRRKPWGKKLMAGYYETSRTWLRNYYKRSFREYPAGVSEKVVGTMINLSRDSKNTIWVEYISQYTGRRYVVHMLPARAHLERDDQGNLLVAHVYRTGREPYEEEFEDNVERNLLAHAMLQGYAEKRADGKWYVNDEPNPRVKVVFHYMTRDMSRIQTPAEVESYSAEVTALAEKMLADKEFLAYWAEQEAKNGKVATGAARAKAAKDAKTKKKKA